MNSHTSRVYGRSVLVTLVLAALLWGWGAAEGSTQPGEKGKPASKAAGATIFTRASWYGPQFDGRVTASGRVFDANALSGAHRTLPFGSDVRVTNLANGRSIVIRIDDRGPYVEGRGIDLSREAARRLGMMQSGVAEVQLDVLPSVRDLAPIPVAVRRISLSNTGQSRALVQ